MLPTDFFPWRKCLLPRFCDVECLERRVDVVGQEVLPLIGMVDNDGSVVSHGFQNHWTHLFGSEEPDDVLL